MYDNHGLLLVYRVSLVCATLLGILCPIQVVASDPTVTIRNQCEWAWQGARLQHWMETGFDGNYWWGHDEEVDLTDDALLAPGESGTITMPVGTTSFNAQFALGGDQVTIFFAHETNEDWTLSQASASDYNLDVILTPTQEGQTNSTFDKNIRAQGTTQGNWFSNYFREYLLHPYDYKGISNMAIIANVFATNLWGMTAGEADAVSNVVDSLPITSWTISAPWFDWEIGQINWFDGGPLDDTASYSKTTMPTWGLHTNWLGGFSNLRSRMRALICWGIVVLFLYMIAHNVFASVYQTMLPPAFAAQNLTIAGTTIPGSGFVIRLGIAAFFVTVLVTLPALLFTFTGGTSLDPAQITTILTTSGPLAQVKLFGGGTSDALNTLNNWLPIYEFSVWVLNYLAVLLFARPIVIGTTLLAKCLGA